jgi:FkbM family methyltransferase
VSPALSRSEQGADASRPASFLLERSFFRLMAWQYRFFEPELRHLRELVRPARSAVDVGASLGTWSWWLARSVPFVHAFEPNAEVAAALARVLPPNVHVHAEAVSDEVGQAVLSIPPGGPSTSQRAGCRLLGLRGLLGLDGRASLLPLGGPSVAVPTVTLDSLDLGQVGFLKVDVEGHEHEVLNGAFQLLMRDRPNVVLEVEHQFHSDGSSMNDVFRLLTEIDYTGRYLLNGRWYPLEHFDVRIHQLNSLERVQRSGLLGNMLFNARRYVNNFAFFPSETL